MSGLNPPSFLFGFLCFFGLVLFQILWWRLRKRFMIGWMFLTFLFIPLVLFFISGERAGSVLLLALSLSYLFGFPAVVARSPSLEILKLVHQHTPKGGISREAILEDLAKADLLQDRIRDMASDGMISQEGGRMKMRRFGKLVGAFFYYYRKALGLAPGRG